MKKLIMIPSINPGDLLNFLTNEKITIEDLSIFKETMLSETKANWLIQGNLKKRNSIGNSPNGE